MSKPLTHQHEHYLYNEENKVFARTLGQERVLAKEFALDADHGKDIDDLPITANQAAYNYVQAVINPDDVDAQRKYGKRGFLHPDFLALVSERCRPVVEAAYAAAKAAK